MISASRESLCREAELYYYDFIEVRSRDSIPENILSHIEGCRNCRERIDAFAAR